jgi:hypothetical protein
MRPCFSEPALNSERHDGRRAVDLGARQACRPALTGPDLTRESIFSGCRRGRTRRRGKAAGHSAVLTYLCPLSSQQGRDKKLGGRCQVLVQ